MAVYGLNNYVQNTATKSGYTNFQWVLPNMVARSSQPNYGGHDAVQSLDFRNIDFLKSKNIKCVISSNEFPVDERSKKLLKGCGIKYFHFPVRDWSAAPAEALRSVAMIIERNRKAGIATLIHCGFGKGRTGTMVAGWAMQAHMRSQAGANIDQMCTHQFLNRNFGVETQAQVSSIRLAAGLSVVRPAPAPLLPPGLGLFSAGASGSGPSGIPLPPNNSGASFRMPGSGSGSGFRGPGMSGFTDII